MVRQLVQSNGLVPYNGTTVTTLGIIRNANPDLRWEVKSTFNVGLDMAFWQQRIVLTADFYTSRTTDMLYSYDVPVPPFTYNRLLANLGKMRNHGVEFGIGITPIRQRDMELSVNMNWTFVANKLVTLDGDYNGQHLTAPAVKGLSGLYGAGYHGSSDVCFQMVGQPLGVFDLEGQPILDRNGQQLVYYPDQVLLDLSGSPYVETAGARMYKYEIDKNAPKDGKLMDNDIVLFRFADVLLMRAEAKFRLAVGDLGQSDFDLVRNRVGATPRTISLQALLDERLLELCWEGWRRQDLIRFGQYRSLYQGPDAVDESDGHTCLFPIPADALDPNKNLTQNPGY